MVPQASSSRNIGSRTTSARLASSQRWLAGSSLKPSAANRSPTSLLVSPESIRVARPATSEIPARRRDVDFESPERKFPSRRTAPRRSSVPYACAFTSGQLYAKAPPADFPVCPRDVTVFEKNDYAGGHSHTATIAEEGRELGLDTGFIVYNDRTYPRFSGMLADLGVATQPSEMSFCMRCDRCAVEYSGSRLRGLFPRLPGFATPRPIALGDCSIRTCARADGALVPPALRRRTA